RCTPRRCTNATSGVSASDSSAANATGMRTSRERRRQGKTSAHAASGERRYRARTENLAREPQAGEDERERREDDERLEGPRALWSLGLACALGRRRRHAALGLRRRGIRQVHAANLYCTMRGTCRTTAAPTSA